MYNKNKPDKSAKKTTVSKQKIKENHHDLFDKNDPVYMRNLSEIAKIGGRLTGTFVPEISEKDGEVLGKNLAELVIRLLSHHVF